MYRHVNQKRFKFHIRKYVVATRYNEKKSKGKLKVKQSHQSLKRGQLN